jgi:hypothetical protein
VNNYWIKKTTFLLKSVVLWGSCWSIGSFVSCVYLYIDILDKVTLRLVKLYFNIADVVELSRALDIRLSDWCCSVTMVWVQIPPRENKKIVSSNTTRNWRIHPSDMFYQRFFCLSFFHRYQRYFYRNAQFLNHVIIINIKVLIPHA